MQRKYKMCFYSIHRTHANLFLANDIDFQGVHIVSLPSIPVKSVIPGEFLINTIDFDHHLESLLKGKGKKLREIDCQFIQTISDLQDDEDLVYLKNVHQSSLNSLIKQIRRK